MSDTEVASVYLTLGLDTSEWLEELNNASDRINKLLSEKTDDSFLSFAAYFVI